MQINYPYLNANQNYIEFIYVILPGLIVMAVDMCGDATSYGWSMLSLKG